MIPSESSILLKNFVSWNFMLRHCITVSLWSFTKTLNQFFDLSRARENLEISIPVWFVQLNESKEFWGNLIGSYFNKWTLSQKYKMGFRWKLLYVRLWFLYDCHPQWIRYPKNFIFRSSPFPGLDNSYKKRTMKSPLLVNMTWHTWH